MLPAITVTKDLDKIGRDNTTVLKLENRHTLDSDAETKVDNIKKKHNYNLDNFSCSAAIFLSASQF